MMYIRFPLSLRRADDLLHDRGIDVSYKTVRAWSNRLGPMFAAEIRKEPIASSHGASQWKWHMDEILVRINAKLITYGGTSIMRAKFLRHLLQRNVTARQHLDF